MIIIFHNNNEVSKIVSNKIGSIPFELKSSISKTLLDIAAKFPEEFIFWCHELYEYNLNIDDVKQYVGHHKMMLSYNPSDRNYLINAIGYVEQSPFIKINKSVRYPTWQMSSAVGVIHATVLNAFQKLLQPTLDFDYFLNSLAKIAMPKGLFCYSEPNLLKGKYSVNRKKLSKLKLYRFVKQHYEFQWLFLLFFNELIYEKRISLVPLLQLLFYKSRRNIHIDLSDTYVNSNIKIVENGTIDVIIPTIGRKKYLYDVLCDLRNQTQLPKNVIIVEQNPAINSLSELNYLENEEWPFTIKHTFTHQAGACNARNIALSQVESEWVFLNDDDNRFAANLLEDALMKANQLGVLVFSTAYPQLNEKVTSKIVNQSSIFGSGNSFVKTSCLKNVSFDMGFEFGYGEDVDFGMQLRNKGFDIMYFPEFIITHLKAPMGGFRTKPIFLWSDEIIQPKPSPTVMLFNLKHQSIEQLKGYKTILFFKYYQVQKIKNPFSYFFSLQQQWDKSVFWANELMKTNNHEI